jgi:hypothetical protein
LIGGAAVAAPTEIMVVASLHGLHKTDPHYSYDDLSHLVQRFEPDWVGVEIRPEDMSADPAFVASLYPHEMVTLKDLYGARSFGFDWFGDEFAGRPISRDDLRSGRIKTLERDSDNAPELQTADRHKLSLKIDALSRREAALLDGITPETLNAGTYDRLSARRYAIMRRWLAGTRFAALTDFYAARDSHIADAVGRFIKAHRGQRIVIVTGADHHGPLVKQLKTRFGASIRLVPVGRS